VVTTEHAIKLDASRNPKTIDITPLMPFDARDAGKPLLAIYSIESNRLMICGRVDRRPTELKAGDDVSYFVLEREK